MTKQIPPCCCFFLARPVWEHLECKSLGFEHTKLPFCDHTPCSISLVGTCCQLAVCLAKSAVRSVQVLLRWHGAAGIMGTELGNVAAGAAGEESICPGLCCSWCWPKVVSCSALVLLKLSHDFFCGSCNKRRWDKGRAQAAG